jgi:HEAT repeat protein
VQETAGFGGCKGFSEMRLMLNNKTIVVILAVGLFTVSVGFGQTLDQNWDNYLHYLLIRQDLAKGYAQAILQGNPDPVQLFELSEKNPQGFQLLLRVKDIAPDAELTELTGKILDVIEKGSFARSTDTAVIAEEIKRLNSTERGRLAAVQRLKNAGEYAIPLMIKALSDSDRKDEFTEIALALPQVGRDAIRPLSAALQTEDTVLKSQIVTAMGKIGYAQVLPFLKYVVEKSGSEELRSLARGYISAINPAASGASAAQLFYELAEQYYYHAQSLAPAHQRDNLNIWFWDSATGELVCEEVASNYFYELMAMRCCEWALKSDANFGSAISLWLASYFKAEAAGVSVMPEYFGAEHPDAGMYATTAGVEYLHQALARAIKDSNSYIALGLIEALATTAGEKSLLYQVGQEQPLVQALSFNNRMVKYSAAIAIASALPKEGFAQSRLVVSNLAEALVPDNIQASGADKLWNEQIAENYAIRSAKAMLELAKTHNPVIDLSLALDTLVKVVNSDNPEIQILAGQILSYMANSKAQQAIVQQAMDADKDLDVRIAAFESLATSAKFNANMLTEAAIDGIYKLIQSDSEEQELRDAAAKAYGALNLPSRKVKDLILDQAKS